MTKDFRKQCLRPLLRWINPVGEPLEGIDTSLSSTARPQGLCTHDQYATDYIRIMMELGINLPMGEDRSVPLITEV